MAFEALKGKWERLSVRERRLVLLCALTFVGCVLGFLGLNVTGELQALGEKNAETRSALRALAESREEILQSRGSQASITTRIGDEAPRLASYLESVANEIGIQIPETVERPTTTKGKFQEKSVEVKLRGLTIEQLAEFLKKIETKSPIVVTQRVYVKRSSFGQDGKLDSVEITVGTYERAKKEKAAAEKPDSGVTKSVGEPG